MGLAQRVPDDRPPVSRLQTLPPPGWEPPPQFIPEDAPRGARLTRFLAGAGFLVVFYQSFDERGGGLMPFIVVIAYLWLKADQRIARSEGFGKDW